MEPLLYLTRRGMLRSPLCSSCLRRSLYPSRRITRTNLQTSTRYKYSTASPRSAQASNEEENVDSDDADIPQAQPLGDYYSDILKMPSQPASRKVRPNIPPPQPQPESISTNTTSSSELPPDDPKSRFGIVFGTRLAGPGYSSRYNPDTMPPESTWKTINGVPIPPRPSEPDNCCMSGCVNCVWDDYRDEVESWAARIQEAQKRQPETSTWSDKAKAKREGKGRAKGSPKDVSQHRRREVESASMSMDDDGGPSPAGWGTGLSMDEDDLFADIPVGIREFMRTEKKLKKRRQSERSEDTMM